MNRKYRRKYLFEFAKEKTNYKNKFYKIVFYAEEEDIFRIIRTVSNNSSMKMRIEKILFPKTIHDMCSNQIVINTELDVDYLRSYYIRIFCEYKEHIESYIDMKNQYEKIEQKVERSKNKLYDNLTIISNTKKYLESNSKYWSTKDGKLFFQNTGVMIGYYDLRNELDI